MALFVFHLSSCDNSEDSKSEIENSQSSSLPEGAGKNEPSPEDIAELANLEKALGEAKEGRDRAKAYLAVLHQLAKMEKDAEVLRRGEEFLEIKAMVSKGPAMLLMAEALENQGKVDDAIVLYEKIAERNMGYIGLSVPANRSGAELRWARDLPSSGGNPSDRQIAYQNLHRFFKMTERIYPKFKEEEKVAWGDLKLLMKTYEDHEDTLPVSQ